MKVVVAGLGGVVARRSAEAAFHLACTRRQERLRLPGTAARPALAGNML
jgi:hypothetical protein